jgi:signal transduction histidine kinase
MLEDFISAHREEIIRRAREKVSSRMAPRPTTHELTHGVPLFLTQLGDVLRLKVNGPEIGAAATRHGSDLLRQGFSIAQVVHDYGDLCQAITELAVDRFVPIGTDEFQTLNACLDNAIAGAVTEFARQRDVDVFHAETRRLGFFAHELRNHLNTAMLAFQVVKSGRVGVTGSTIEVLDRSLRALRVLIDRSVTEVRLESGTHYRERLRVADVIEEIEIDASILAAERGLRITVERVDRGLEVDVDRHLFASAVSNLLQNAFKFTRPAGHVTVRTRSTGDHVAIDVEDECGGLPPGAADAMFRLFQQHGTNHAGLGLGLSISRQAIEADGGKISVRDIPGKGCVFTVEMPLAVGDRPESVMASRL